jgi:hypothetical protein
MGKSKLVGKWCINITKENQQQIKKIIDCGAGYYINQTIFLMKMDSVPLSVYLIGIVMEIIFVVV